MFAVLHIDDFALHAVLRTEAGATERPAALFSNTGKKSIVLATNPRARAAGVEPGMTAPQAVARCPELVIRSPHAGAEADARAALLAVGFTLSPSIENTSPGVCTADVKGFDPAKLESAVGTAVGRLTALGLPATGGIARTPLLALYAARAAAHRSRSSPSFCPTLANDDLAFCVAETETKNDYEERERTPILTGASRFSDLGGTPMPRGTGVPPVGLQKSEVRPVLIITDERTFLAPLPLAAADPSPILAPVLGQWGLRTLGDLTALPRDEIVRRFGAEGLALWQRASGGAPRPLHPVVPTRHFAAELEFENEIETLEPLLFLLRRFLDRLTLELRASQHVAAEITLELRLEDETQYTRSFRLPEPTADVEILFRTLHTHLESLQTAASICALALRLTPARPLVRQQGLFETGLRDPHGFAETLARLSVLVGSDRVGTPQMEDTHRPDAVKLVSPPAVVSPPAEPPLHAPLGLPLRRFRPPLPARVEFTDDRPTYLWTEHIRGEISAQSSAFPSLGDWWQHDRAWARTEWDIALAEGGLYRLLLIDNAWFIEGEYD